MVLLQCGLTWLEGVRRAPVDNIRHTWTDLRLVTQNPCRWTEYLLSFCCLPMSVCLCVCLFLCARLLLELSVRNTAVNSIVELLECTVRLRLWSDVFLHIYGDGPCIHIRTHVRTQTGHDIHVSITANSCLWLLQKYILLASNVLSWSKESEM